MLKNKLLDQLNIINEYTTNLLCKKKLNAIQLIEELSLWKSAYDMMKP